jgi:hypothetical protein
MNKFVGPRPEWDAHGAGTIRFEIDLELWSNSGRPLHLDPTVMGGFLLVERLARMLRELPERDDVAIHKLRYYGTGSEVASAHYIGNGPAAT